MIRICKERFFTPSGSPERAVYRSSLKKDGTIVIEVCGTENIQDMINSHVDSCSIELILARCSRGDMSGLSAKQGVYTDITDMPKTFADVLQKVIDGRNLFDSLPKNVRERFGNDFNSWFVQTGSAEWFEKMGIVSKDSVVPLKDEKSIKEDISVES